MRDGERWNCFSVSFQLGFPFLISCLDGGFDLVYGCSVGFWDDQADAVFRGAAVDAFRIPYVGVGPSGIDSCDYFLSGLQILAWYVLLILL